MYCVQTQEKIDNWGFPFVWLPFGKPGAVSGVNGTYYVESSDILNDKSISTLAGLPVYYFHPDDPVVTPDNIEQSKSLGVLTDKYRQTLDGGGEILARLYSQKTMDEINNQKITETSPVYAIIEGVRTYNHIAILPPGYARGGGKMRIQVEGNPQEIFSILDTSGVPDSPTVSNNTNIMEELLGKIYAEQQELRTAVACCIAKVEGLALVEEVETEEKPSEVYQEGFDAGVAAGELISTAKQYGFEGTDVSEAQSHLVTSAFPEIKIEGFSVDMLRGLVTGAIASLMNRKVLEAVPVAVEGSPVEVAPTVKVETANKTRKSRFKMQQASL